MDGYGDSRQYPSTEGSWRQWPPPPYGSALAYSLGAVFACAFTSPPSGLYTTGAVNRYIGIRQVFVLISLFIFSEVKGDYYPKWWFYKSRGNKKQTEILSDVINNDFSTEIIITPDHTLNINNFKENNSGIYKCKSPEPMVKGNVFKYILEGKSQAKSNGGSALRPIRIRENTVRSSLRTICTVEHTRSDIRHPWISMPH